MSSSAGLRPDGVSGQGGSLRGCHVYSLGVVGLSCVSRWEQGRWEDSRNRPYFPTRTYRDVVGGHMCPFDPNADHRLPPKAVGNSCEDGRLEVTAAITIRTDYSDKHPPKRRYTASG